MHFILRVLINLMMHIIFLIRFNPRKVELDLSMLSLAQNGP